MGNVTKYSSKEGIKDFWDEKKKKFKTLPHKIISKKTILFPKDQIKKHIDDYLKKKKITIFDYEFEITRILRDIFQRTKISLMDNKKHIVIASIGIKILFLFNLKTENFDKIYEEGLTIEEIQGDQGNIGLFQPQNNTQLNEEMPRSRKLLLPYYGNYEVTVRNSQIIAKFTKGDYVLIFNRNLNLCSKFLLDYRQEHQHQTLNLTNTVYGVTGKLGYEIEARGGNAQFNSFFTSRSKKMALCSKNGSSYKIDGGFNKGILKEVDGKEFVDLIHELIYKNTRFEFYARVGENLELYLEYVERTTYQFCTKKAEGFFPGLTKNFKNGFLSKNVKIRVIPQNKILIVFIKGPYFSGGIDQDSQISSLRYKNLIITFKILKNGFKKMSEYIVPKGWTVKEWNIGLASMNSNLIIIQNQGYVTISVILRVRINGELEKIFDGQELDVLVKDSIHDFFVVRDQLWAFVSDSEGIRLSKLKIGY